MYILYCEFKLAILQKNMSHRKSPEYKQGPSLIPESLEEVVTCDAELVKPMPSAYDMQQPSYPDPAASSISSSASASMRSTFSMAPLHKRQSIAVDRQLGDHLSNSSVTDKGPASIDSNMNSPSSGSSNSNQLHNHQHIMMQEQVPHEQRYKFQVQNYQFQMSSQGKNHSYISSGQFFHGPPATLKRSHTQ